jgi:ATP-binding cassette subfamily B (MDR/TAP) protein 1
VEILTTQDTSPSLSPTRGVRNLTSPPSTPIRSPAAAARQAAQARSPSTPQTLRRAINTALPATPSSSRPAAPPSAFTPRLAETNEHPLTPQSQRVSHTTDSPFDDRHSIYIEQQPIDEDPFEYADTVTDARRQETMSAYSSSHTAAPRRLEGYDTGLPLVSQYTRPIYASRHDIQPTTLSQQPDLHRFPSSKDPPSSSPQRVVPIAPTFRGLFYFTRPKDYLVCFLPALACSITAALVQPFMSKIIGEAFDVFVRFPLDARGATSADKDALMKGITTTTIELVGAGAAALVLNYAKGALWARHGEMVVDRLRKAVFDGVQEKGMTWFDMGMGMREEDQEEGETVGAGGLMAKSTR